MKLNEKNSKILYNLFENSRQSYTQLAKKCGISKESVSYRIESLQKKGIITQFAAVVDPYKLNKRLFRIMMKGSIKCELEQLKEFTDIAWVIQLSGGIWTFSIGYYAKNAIEFRKSLSHIFESLNGVSEYSMMEVLGIEYYFPQLIQENTIVKKTGSQELVDISANEQRILKELLRNGRISIVELSLKNNLSVTATTYLVKKLQKDNVIVGTIPVIDYTVLGYDHYKIFIYLENPNKYHLVKESMRKHPGLIFITKIIGGHDVECEIIAKNLTEITDYLDNLNKHNALRKYEIILTKNVLLQNTGI